MRLPWRAFGILAVSVVSSHAADEATNSKIIDIPIRSLDLSSAPGVSFSKDIKPILVNHCMECHSAEDRSGGFDVTSVSTLLRKGKKAGPGVIPGKPDASAIVQYIRGLREPQMPKSGQLLSMEQLHTVRLWIAAGAVDDSEAVANAERKEATIRNTARMKLLGKNKDAQALVAELLYARNNEERFFIGRKLRLALLPPPPEPPTVSEPANNPIDQFIAAKWQDAPTHSGWKPELCDDAAFVRRIHLDLIGVVPSAEVARRFVQDETTDKRARLIDELLGRNEDYAAHWTSFWEEALGSADAVAGIPANGNYRDRIFNGFVANKPYDLMVAELIDPTLPGHKKTVSYGSGDVQYGNIGYIRSNTHEETIQTASNVAQVFLGTSMKCASCHSHMLNKEWPQARFLAFAGMFAAKDLELIRCEKKSGQTIASKFPFALPGVPETLPVRKEDRLHRLAMMLVDPNNPRFSLTIVNRLWKRYLGLGLFEPVDDFRNDRPPSHPALLDWLADDLMRHEFDLKRTIRLILNSRTYQLKYDPAVEDTVDVEKPEQPRFVRSPSLRRLTAEQFVDSVRFISTGRLDPKERVYLEKKSTALTRSLGRPESRREISTGRSDAVAIVQWLEFLNGPELHQYVYSGEWKSRFCGGILNPAEAVNELYWTVLNRHPAIPEIDAGLSYLKGTFLADAALLDMLWALVVSPEFQFIR